MKRIVLFALVFIMTLSMGFTFVPLPDKGTTAVIEVCPYVGWNSSPDSVIVVPFFRIICDDLPLPNVGWNS